MIAKVVSAKAGEKTKYGHPLYKVYSMNGCCKNVPFIVVKHNDGRYSCECSCGLWNTNAYEDPISPVLEYLQMSGVRRL